MMGLGEEALRALRQTLEHDAARLRDKKREEHEAGQDCARLSGAPGAEVARERELREGRVGEGADDRSRRKGEEERARGRAAPRLKARPVPAEKLNRL